MAPQLHGGGLSRWLEEGKVKPGEGTVASQVDSSSSINSSFDLFPSQSQWFEGKWEADLLHLWWPAPGQGLLEEVCGCQQGEVEVEEEEEISEEPLVVEMDDKIKEFQTVKAKEEVDEIVEFLSMGA